MWLLKVDNGESSHDPHFSGESITCNAISGTFAGDNWNAIFLQYS